MTELKRWAEQGAPPTIECLLEAARSEQPSEASLTRALVGLGVAVGVSSSTANAGAAGSAAGIGASASSKGSTVGLLGLFGKWLSIGIAVSGAGIGVHLMADEQTWPTPPQPSAQASSISKAPREPRPSDTPAQRTLGPPGATSSAPYGTSAATSLAPGQESAGSSAFRTSGGVHAYRESASPAETLSHEIAIIDRARGLLAAGHASEAMAALDEYERRFAQRHFAPEALYLRLEALLVAGRTTEARALARRLLASYPTSPHSEKARHLLERENE